MTVTEAILAINAGSSSIKFGVYDAAGLGVRLKGRVTAIDTADVRFQARSGKGESIVDQHWGSSSGCGPIERLLAWIDDHLDGVELVAAGHRVVHGGGDFTHPVAIDADILGRLTALTPLAPLHQPGSLAPIRALSRLRSDLLQVACFDTAFHSGLTPPAGRFAIPRALEEKGIRRYGFHGLSYESIAQTLRTRDDGAGADLVVVAHLGSGASLCAMKALHSIDTTMGFSPLDGVVMGTRPGSLDPGILLYLMREEGYDLDGLEIMLNHQCGLAGISGIGSDVVALLASPLREAREAIEQFAFSIAGHVAMLATTLGGLDRLIFTGGIGEHAWQVRAMIADRLGWLGLRLDRVANKANAALISSNSSSIRAERIATDEEGVIVGHAARLYGKRD
ncbi:acetate/propionate family kinase [Rhizorhabdus argentea]|uniref:acetate/propionate family kinase n=1 Tax=Rhizorhabdus argentea TaxID=1387174 RepID=UPI0030EB3988